MRDALKKLDGALRVIRAHMDSTGKDLSPVLDLADVDALLDTTETALRDTFEWVVPSDADADEAYRRCLSVARAVLGELSPGNSNDFARRALDAIAATRNAIETENKALPPTPEGVRRHSLGFDEGGIVAEAMAGKANGLAIMGFARAFALLQAFSTIDALGEEDSTFGVLFAEKAKDFVP